jgi:hypothetical protein
MLPAPRIESVRQHALNETVRMWFAPEPAPPLPEITNTLMFRILDELWNDLIALLPNGSNNITERQLADLLLDVRGLVAPLHSIGRANQATLSNFECHTALVDVLDFWRHFDSPRNTWRQETYPLDDGDFQGLLLLIERYLAQPVRSPLLSFVLIDLCFAMAMFLIDDECHQDYGDDAASKVRKVADDLLLLGVRTIYSKLLDPNVSTQTLAADFSELERGGLRLPVIGSLLEDAEVRGIQARQWALWSIE